MGDLFMFILICLQDGNELPPAISFDVDAPSTLPPIQVGLLFLVMYFKMESIKLNGFSLK